MPRTGSIVPMEHYNTYKNVQSIMLEINRVLLEEPTNKKSDRYPEIKRITGEFIKLMKDSLN